MSKTLQEYDKEISKLEDELHRLESDRGKLQHFLLQEKFGVKGGSIVTSRGKRFQVVRIDLHRWADLNKPWLVANPEKKDGSFGTAKRTLYDWELV